MSLGSETRTLTEYRIQRGCVWRLTFPMLRSNQRRDLNPLPIHGKMTSTTRQGKSRLHHFEKCRVLIRGKVRWCSPCQYYSQHEHEHAIWPFPLLSPRKALPSNVLPLIYWSTCSPNYVSFPLVLILFKIRTQCSESKLAFVCAVLGTDETLDWWLKTPEIRDLLRNLLSRCWIPRETRTSLQGGFLQKSLSDFNAASWASGCPSLQAKSRILCRKHTTLLSYM